ncbi:MAG: hypothetical protein WBA57_04325 [Elainellaceae cyanobacterium]
MNSWSNYLERPETPAENRLFAHLQAQAKDVHPTEAIASFRQLFIDGSHYPIPSILSDLDFIVNAGFAQNEYKFILNRSCYIFINAWWSISNYRIFIPELIRVFEEPSTSTSYNQTVKRQRALAQNFAQSQQYFALQRTAMAIEAEWNYTRYQESEKPLETIISRYPYIYEYNLLTRDSNLEQRHTVRAMRQEAQRKFDIDLARYGAFRTTHQNAPESEKARKNPTLLRTDQLDFAVQQFKGKVDGSNTQRDLAQQFITYSKWTRSYRDYKRDLYDYLMPVLQGRFSQGKHHFNQRLSDYLQKMLNQYDAQSPSASLNEHTCKKLLNFLVVESMQRPDHANFFDLLGNMGATLTVSLLLKIVLLCSNAKPWLEQRLAILFNHYAPRPKRDVIWLVEALENTNVAFSVNFPLSSQGTALS